MEDELYKFEDEEVSAYRTLRDKAEKVDENPAMHNISEYDAVVEIDGEEYGVHFEDDQALAEKQLRESGAEVYGARDKRGSRSGRTFSEDLEGDTSVTEAVNAGLEPEERRKPGQEPEVDSNENLRYGLGKVVAE